MVFWNVHTCHQNITLQEIAVNAILTKKEWESMPTGLFDQVRNFKKAFLQNNVLSHSCILIRWPRGKPQLCASLPCFIASQLKPSSRVSLLSYHHMCILHIACSLSFPTWVMTTECMQAERLQFRDGKTLRYVTL